MGVERLLWGRKKIHKTLKANSQNFRDGPHGMRFASGLVQALLEDKSFSSAVGASGGLVREAPEMGQTYQSAKSQLGWGCDMIGV